MRSSKDRSAASSHLGEDKRKKSIGRPINKKEDEGYELVFDILLGIRNTVRLYGSRFSVISTSNVLLHVSGKPLKIQSAHSPASCCCYVVFVI